MTQLTPAGGRRSVRLGIQGRLFLAFGGVAMLAAFASVMAWWSLTETGRSMGEIGRSSVPAIVRSLTLAKDSTAIAADAPAVAASRDAAELTERMDGLTKRLAGLRDRIGAMRSQAGGGSGGGTGGMAADADAVAKLLERMGAALDTLGKRTAERLALEEKLNTLVADAVMAHEDFTDLVAPLLEVSTLSVNNVVGDLAAAQAVETATGLGRRLAQEELPVITQLMNVQANGNLAFGMIAAASSVPHGATLNNIRSKYNWALLRVDNAIGALPKDSPDRPSLVKARDGLAAFGGGAGSVFRLRDEQARITADIESALAETVRLTTDLNGTIDAVVAHQQERTDADVTRTETAISGAVAIQGSAAAVVVLSSLLIAWFYVRNRLTRRLMRVIDAMRAVAGGDLAADAAVGGRDEIAEMAGIVGVFRDKSAEIARLQEEQDAMKQAADAERSRTIQSITASIEASVKEASRHISAASADMREASEGMSSTAEQTCRRMTDVRSAVADTATNVQTVAATASQLSASIGEITRRVGDSSQIARSAVEEARSTNDLMVELAAAAQKIGDVVGMINAIAGQTNLLALNATIEAARAGEAGRGFAVVAEEVRSLAGQTAKATEEIAQQVQAVRTTAQGAVSAIDDIGRTISRIDEITAMVAAAVEEQSAATDEIARSINHASDAVQSIADTVVSVDDAVNRTGSAAAQVVDATRALSQRSESLSEDIDRLLGRIRAA
ncbi:HAMP domain-containing protein [Azospirillum melinis]|uniref:HAMP domain-containing protein n=1 Tax=Azospirillum melinis TaxID=328839 RepID=A0ABX2KEP5_9PROT|nr:methyl-accepting chemotaxis protein [Azospirillum melinis]MBP2308190.1 methyl-accepting chemotaxis protein [Azospirillum melinis]NUA99875.1 HAMP domain-containing protein [Azospirillum melinis]